jgi:predicted Rossmann fold nucleotide-binding protein DprA/Smf involved in DNA uptake
MNDTEKTRKEMLKKLRETRKPSIEALSRKVKEQNKIIAGIRQQLGEGPKTVPCIASALGLPASEVMWFVASLKKYGEVAEGEKEDGYFQYELAGARAEEASGPAPGKD